MSKRKYQEVERSPDGRYIRFDKKMGVGAYKSVWLAYDTEQGIEVAWNTVDLNRLPPKEKNRLRGETDILKGLSHPNVINFFTVWGNPDRDEIIFTTEIMSSGTLKEYTTRTKDRIKLKVIKKWCRQILLGLNYLHTRNPPVIHRDLKCDNIFINGATGDIRIGDLGLSTQKGSVNLVSVLGTPEFMAPELYEESYTEKVDIYAFGMCLIEMCTNEYPYQECTNPAQIYKKVTKAIKPAVLSRIVDEQVREFISICLDSEQKRLSAVELLYHPFLMLEYAGPRDNFPVWFEDADEFGLEDERDTEGLKTHQNKNLEDPPISVVSSHPAICVEGHDEEKANLALKLQYGDRRRVVKFEFNFDEDTAHSIASEMVRELKLQNSEKHLIAKSVEESLNQILPDRFDGLPHLEQVPDLERPPDVQLDAPIVRKSPVQPTSPPRDTHPPRDTNPPRESQPRATLPPRSPLPGHHAGHRGQVTGPAGGTPHPGVKRVDKSINGVDNGLSGDERSSEPSIIDFDPLFETAHVDLHHRNGAMEDQNSSESKPSSPGLPITTSSAPLTPLPNGHRPLASPHSKHSQHSQHSASGTPTRPHHSISPHHDSSNENEDEDDELVHLTLKETLQKLSVKELKRRIAELGSDAGRHCIEKSELVDECVRLEKQKQRQASASSEKSGRRYAPTPHSDLNGRISPSSNPPSPYPKNGDHHLHHSSPHHSYNTSHQNSHSKGPGSTKSNSPQSTSPRSPLPHSHEEYLNGSGDSSPTSPTSSFSISDVDLLSSEDQAQLDAMLSRHESSIADQRQRYNEMVAKEQAKNRQEYLDLQSKLVKNAKKKRHKQKHASKSPLPHHTHISQKQHKLQHDRQQHTSSTSAKHQQAQQPHQTPIILPYTDTPTLEKAYAQPKVNKPSIGSRDTSKPTEKLKADKMKKKRLTQQPRRGGRNAGRKGKRQQRKSVPAIASNGKAKERKIKDAAVAEKIAREAEAKLMSQFTSEITNVSTSSASDSGGNTSEKSSGNTRVDLNLSGASGRNISMDSNSGRSLRGKKAPP